MNDRNKGRYHKLYVKEFEEATEVLGGLDGELAWGKHDFEAFTYREKTVKLVFYPHKTSAGNIHIRVRDQHSIDKERAKKLMRLLYKKTPYTNTFWCKSS